MEGGALWAAVHGVAKSQIQLSNFTFTFHFHALEKEMATHSSVLAWRIPGTGEPGGLPSMGSHRVGHDWNDLAAAVVSYFTHTHTSPCTHSLKPLKKPQCKSQYVSKNWHDTDCVLLSQCNENRYNSMKRWHLHRLVNLNTILDESWVKEEL